MHCEIVKLVQICDKCRIAGKNLECIQSQKQYGKLPITKNANEENSIVFVGPFQNTRKSKKYLLVSVDNHSGWPEAMFLTNLTAERVVEILNVEILNENLSKHGFPKRIKTDPGTVFFSRIQTILQ